MSATPLTAEAMPATASADLTPVLAELWISFVSLMRSHLATLQTLGSLLQVKLLETAPNSFIAGDLNGNIAVSFSPADGSGVYEIKSCGAPTDKGTWKLNLAGTALIGSGEDEDMELAVEFFAQKLMAARSEGEIR